MFSELALSPNSKRSKFPIAMEDSSLLHRDSAMARGYDLGSCVFSGSVFIHFDLLRSSVTRCLNLDAIDLVIDSASISFSVAPSPVSFFRPVDVELEVRRRSGLRVGFLDRIARGGLLLEVFLRLSTS